MADQLNIRFWLAAIVLAAGSTHASEKPFAAANAAQADRHYAVAGTMIASTETAQTQNAWAGKLQRSKSAGKADADPFSSKSWLPPPKVEPPPAPTVPAFPFSFLGKMTQVGTPTKLFLMRGEQLYTVAPGDVVGGTYRFDVIGDNQIEVTYLPLDKKQRLEYAEFMPRATQTASAAPAQQTPVAMATPGATFNSGPAISAGSSTLTTGAGTSGGFGGAAIAAPGMTQSGQGVGMSATTSTAGASSSGSSIALSSAGGSMQMLPAPPPSAMQILPPPSAGTMRMLPAPSGTIATLPPPSGPPATSPPPTGVSPMVTR